MEHNPWRLQELYFQKLETIKMRRLTPAETENCRLDLINEINQKIGEAIRDGDNAACAAYEQAREYVWAKI